MEYCKQEIIAVQYLILVCLDFVVFHASTTVLEIFDHFHLFWGQFLGGPIGVTF